MMDKEMQQAASCCKFEDAARLRDAIAILKQQGDPPAGDMVGKSANADSPGEEKLTFDWERMQGMAPVLRLPDEHVHGLESPGARKRIEPSSDASLFPGSSRAFAEKEARMDQADRAITNLLNEARNAMHHADDGGALDICEVTKAFDGALRLLVAEGRKDGPGKQISCLRLVLHTLCSASQFKARYVNLGSAAFMQLRATLLELMCI